jgi:exosome complex component CSL4
MDNNVFVVPGEKLATEEEFAEGSNTYVEEGVIYSAIMGNVVKSEGTVGVSTVGREIKIIGKDMLVIGVVTDDMKNVTFVKLDDINMEKKDYLALKDGKIVAPRPRPARFGGRMEGREGRFSKPSERSEKPCGVGDTILARVQYNDKDSYTLSLDGSETGVIYSNCELCGGEMEQKDERLLVCKECGHRSRKKISELYNRPEEIKKLFA